jgi:GT2 family glycosyltransferase
MAFPRRDFVSRLSTLYGNTPPAVVAPAIYSTVTGADQNPHLVRRPGRARVRFYTWVYRYYPTFVAYSALALVWAKLPRRRNAGRGKQGTAGGDADEPQPIYAPQGSFIIFNRRYFESGADLEHGAFLFAEEITVAEKARRHGLDVVYDPRLVVRHREHATTGIFKNRRMARYQWEASVFCYEEYFR